MNELLAIIGLATVLFAIGMWLVLPRGAAAGRALGAVLVAIGLGLLASRIPRLGSWSGDGVFLVLAAVTVLSAVATISFRKPVYSAIWFGLSLLGTAGLLLFQGAQFLGVATIVVYAGAILVTFLFVLMLAQPEGLAPYDQLSWGPWLSAITGALVVGVLTLTVTTVFQNAASGELPQAPFATAKLEQDILGEQHVARLGAQLFSKQLIAVEVAGTLLLVALVGTVAIVARFAGPTMEGLPMDEQALLENYLIVGAMLFGIGLIGFFSRRNMIVMFLAAEMMLQGVSLSLVAWGRYHNDWGGQMLVIFILTVAACEAAIALAVVLSLFHENGSLDIAVWQQLREENQPAFIDRDSAELVLKLQKQWPTLPTAGIEPDHDLAEATHRTHL